MPGRRRRGRKVSGIVALIVALVVGFAGISTAQERFGYGFFGLPQLSIPSFGGLPDPLRQDTPTTLAEGSVEVHFIDVGQGESILILAPEKTVLIDGGDNGQGPTVLRYLSARGVRSIDILIATHPHADHIGGLIDVVQQLPISTVIMPEVPDDLVPTTRTYTNFLMALLESGLSITPAVAGEVHDLGGGAALTILAPVRDYSRLNDMSVVSRLEFGEISFLFTGDIEIAAEHDLATAGGIRSDVLNLAHHGSRTSTTQIFLDAVNPSIAVIACGLDNPHGHPHRTVMERLEAMDIHILRTDFDGSIVIVTDGESIGISTER